MPLPTIESRIAFARTQSFQDKITFLMTKGALAIMGEATNTPNHDIRLAMAKPILFGQASNLSLVVAFAIMTDLANDDTITDANLQIAVFNILNTFAAART